MQIHCVWAAAEAYSAPSIVLTSHSHDGLHVFDDFREAYSWLRHNTEVDDKVRLSKRLLIIFLPFLSSMLGHGGLVGCGRPVYVAKCFFICEIGFAVWGSEPIWFKIHFYILKRPRCH